MISNPLFRRGRSAQPTLPTEARNDPDVAPATAVQVDGDMYVASQPGAHFTIATTHGQGVAEYEYDEGHGVLPPPPSDRAVILDAEQYVGANTAPPRPNKAATLRSLSRDVVVDDEQYVAAAAGGQSKAETLRSTTSRVDVDGQHYVAAGM